MKPNYILYVVIGVLVFLIGFQYFESRKLRQELSASMKSIESKISTFDSKLGRAQATVIGNPKLIESLLKEISTDIKDDISSSLSNVEAILSAKVINQSTGGGRVTRTRAKNKISSKSSEELHASPGGTKEDPDTSNAQSECDWEFKDWRLQASIVGHDFSYKLNQAFDFSLVQTDNTYYLRVWELNQDNQRMTPPLVVHSFSSVRLKQLSNSFDYFNPVFELSIASIFNSFSSPEILPELSISFISYGGNNRNLFRFIRAGIIYGDSFGLSLSPFSYNIGYHLPVFDNIWITPTYSYDSNHNFGLSLGASL